ncbi:hypothetical protein [Kribbella swartbergensis]
MSYPSSSLDDRPRTESLTTHCPLAPAAAAPESAVAPAQPRTWWKRAWSVATTHPLIVTIGGTIVAGAILYWLGFDGS